MLLCVKAIEGKIREQQKEKKSEMNKMHPVKHRPSEVAREAF